MIIDVVKLFLPAVLTFIMGILITPPLTDFLYKNEMWKKKAGKKDMDGNDTPIFNELHKNKEVGTPRMGGIVIWGSTSIVILTLWLISFFFPTESTTKLDLLSRTQTWVPLATLIIGAIIGLIDDYLEIIGSKNHVAGGLSLKMRLLTVGIISFLVGFWFYEKLDVVGIGLPNEGLLYLGVLIVPFFMLLSIALYSGGIIDGLDGLSGGIFATIFAAYGGIAFYQQQINLASFCFVLVGAILAFLWFNIPPARYYMTETGSMALTVTLAVIAFMTDSIAGGYGILVLPIIALPLFATSFSNIIQILSKKFRKKKVFLVAPLHHHFEALGWPAYKVTMRYWILGVMFAMLGLVFALLG
jgi:phospho-N-acetylmuramoyl-pentapeptide-transferase